MPTANDASRLAFYLSGLYLSGQDHPLINQSPTGFTSRPDSMNTPDISPDEKPSRQAGSAARQKKTLSKDGIRIRERQIPPDEIQFETSRASGPGGQHVNTTDSAVLLRFNFRNSKSIPEEIKEKIARSIPGKINTRGEILIHARESRSQIQNKTCALQRLQELLLQAAKKKKSRKSTSIPAGSREQRMKAKKHRADKRRKRQPPEMER